MIFHHLSVKTLDILAERLENLLSIYDFETELSTLWSVWWLMRYRRLGSYRWKLDPLWWTSRFN